MKVVFLTIAMVFAIYGGHAQSKKKIKFKSETDSVSYCIGISIGNAINTQNISGINSDLVSKGIVAMLGDQKGQISLEDAENYLRNYFAKKQLVESEAKQAKVNEFMENNKKTEGVKELPSGLQYIVIQEGTGEMPSDTSTVKTHYKGMFTNGNVFDSSYDRGEPAIFPVNGVIPGFSEALQNMKVGSKWKIFIPPHLGYGEQGSGGVIGPNEILVFELELLEILQNPGE